MIATRSKAKVAGESLDELDSSYDDEDFVDDEMASRSQRTTRQVCAKVSDSKLRSRVPSSSNSAPNRKVMKKNAPTSKAGSPGMVLLFVTH